MKKFVKSGIVIAMALTCMLGLCSCKALDDARYNHGIYLDENRESLELRGLRYTEITEGLDAYDGSVGFETKDGSYLEFVDSGWGGIYITERDVPVLLKDQYGDTTNSIGGDGETPTIISVYHYEEEGGRTIRCYCREDKAEDIEALLKHPKIDEYFLDVSGWEYDTDRFVSLKDLMDSNVKDLVNRNLSEHYDDKTDYLSFDELYDAEDVSEDYLELQSCDDEMIFTDGVRVQIVRTTGKQRKYFVAQTNDGKWGYFDGEIEDGTWYQVSDQDTDALDDLFAQYQAYTKHFYFN